MDWQPIDTAPQNGTPFLAYRHGSFTEFIDQSNPLVGHYEPADWQVTRYEDVTLCFSFGETTFDADGFDYGEDYIETQQPDGSPDGDPPLRLTHWMPLPDPPK